MNYYQARQRESDQRWDFTCKNDNRIWPVGYCHAYRPLTAEQLLWRVTAEHAGEEAARLEAEEAPFRAKYHADGHATAEDAERCYYEYQLDHARPTAFSGAQYPCAVCQAWSQQGMAYEGEGTSVVLCADHANRAGLAQAKPFVPGIAITSSW